MLRFSYDIELRGLKRRSNIDVRMICKSRIKFIDPDDFEHMYLDAQDVIGAAETGSGKTLAFGLPILQRLLDEQEKMVQKSGNPGKGIGSPLRALIITPTRELALQVTDKISL